MFSNIITASPGIVRLCELDTLEQWQMKTQHMALLFCLDPASHFCPAPLLCLPLPSKEHGP